MHFVIALAVWFPMIIAAANMMTAKKISTEDTEDCPLQAGLLGDA